LFDAKSLFAVACRNRAVVKAPTIAASFYDANSTRDRRQSLSVSTLSSISADNTNNNNNNNIVLSDGECSLKSASGIGHEVDHTECCDKHLGNVTKHSSNNQVDDEVVNERTRVISKALRAFTPFRTHHTAEQRTRRSGLSSLANTEMVPANIQRRPSDQ